MLCCVCFHGLGGGVEMGDSFQSYSSQGLIRGDPSQVLACVAGHPRTPSPPTLSLCFLDGSMVANEPWAHARGGIVAMPSSHLSDRRGHGSPGGQDPLSSGLGQESGPWMDEETAIQTVWPSPFRKVWGVVGEGARRAVLS